MNSCCWDYLVGGKIEKAHCVDGDVIGRLLFDGHYSCKLKPSRAECGCAESTDIGAYDTCPNGYVCCYANINKQKARLSHEKHDPGPAFLGRSREESVRWVKEAQEKRHFFFDVTGLLLTRRQQPQDVSLPALMADPVSLKS